MRKLTIGILLALTAALMAFPVGASSHDDSDGKFNITGEIRTRWDYSANIFDADDDGDDPSVLGPTVDDDFDFFPYRARIAATGEFAEDVVGHVEMQGYGFFGNDSPSSTLAHAIGQGFSLNSLSGDDDSEMDLYQAYVHLSEIRDSAWSLRIGRQEYTLGNELHFGDLDFYNGQSFDGIRAMAGFESWDLDLFYFMIDEVTGGITSPNFDDQNEVWGATGAFDIGDNGQEINPYVLFNRNTGSGPSRARVYTYGAQYGREMNEYDAWDWNLELALQSGKVDSDPAEEDVSASIVEGWVGYSWGDDNKHRVHLGSLSASGDDDPLDDDQEAFQPLFPDNHSYNRLGDLDLFGGPSVGSADTGGGISNITDVNLGYTWNGEGRKLRVSLHSLALTEEAANGEDEIGIELNAVYDYMYSENVGFQVGVAQLAPGDYLDASFNGADDADDVQRAWWQVRLMF